MPRNPIRPSSYYKPHAAKPDLAAPRVALTEPLIAHVRPEWLAAWTAVRNKVMIPNNQDGKSLNLNGCWLWEPSALYGKTATVRYDPQVPPVNAQRLMYVIFRGDLMPTQQVRRACKNAKLGCINPNHMRIPVGKPIMPESYGASNYSRGGVRECGGCPLDELDT
jgi:hypothetical protein